MEIIRNKIYSRNPRYTYSLLDGEHGVEVEQSATISEVVAVCATHGVSLLDITAEQFAELLTIFSGSVEDARALAIARNEEYYNSTAVSSFTYGGFPMWTDFTNRQKLRMRLEAEKASGMTNTTIWYSGHRFDLPIAVTQQLLTAVELYASKCFDVRNQHETAINALTDAEEIAAYDYTKGYPEQLKFE